MDILESIKTKFNEQKAKASLPTKCPHCGKKIKFELEHTQTTEVATKLVSIEKE